MEVHHHAHTPRKKWTHYFWEFLMLFLAVFCGFLAENQREHFIEHQREKKYMSTMIEDLTKDTLQYGHMARFFRKCLSRYNKNSSKLRPPVSLTNLETYYTECFEVYNFYSFAYNDRTIEQLRSSGNFRIIRNKKVLELLLLYDQNVRGAFLLNFDVLWKHRLKLLSIQNDIIDKGLSKYFNHDTGNFYQDSLNKSGLLPFRLLTNDTRILFNYYNEWLDNIVHLDDFLTWTDLVSKNATELILLIQNEYHLK